MERKFRCVLFDGTIPLGAIVIEKKIPQGPMGLYNGEFMICHSNSLYARNHFEEITEPRIELKCVGFEEGDLFKFKGLEKVYKVENGVLLYDSIPGGWSQSIMDINGAEIELIPQPTEEDKQVAELKETVEEAMRKIEEIEKARENPTTTN